MSPARAALLALLVACALAPARGMPTTGRTGAGEAAGGLAGGPLLPVTVPLPPCRHDLPNPPLITWLPDGSSIPTQQIGYDTEAGAIRIYEHVRIFCDDFE